MITTSGKGHKSDIVKKYRNLPSNFIVHPNTPDCENFYKNDYCATEEFPSTGRHDVSRAFKLKSRPSSTTSNFADDSHDTVYSIWEGETSKYRISFKKGKELRINETIYVYENDVQGAHVYNGHLITWFHTKSKVEAFKQTITHQKTGLVLGELVNIYENDLDNETTLGYLTANKEGNKVICTANKEIYVDGGAVQTTTTFGYYRIFELNLNKEETEISIKFSSHSTGHVFTYIYTNNSFNTVVEESFYETITNTSEYLWICRSAEWMWSSDCWGITPWFKPYSYWCSEETGGQIAPGETKDVWDGRKSLNGQRVIHTIQSWSGTQLIDIAYNAETDEIVKVTRQLESYEDIKSEDITYWGARAFPNGTGAACDDAGWSKGETWELGDISVHRTTLWDNHIVDHHPYLSSTQRHYLKYNTRLKLAMNTKVWWSTINVNHSSSELLYKNSKIPLFSADFIDKGIPPGEIFVRNPKYYLLRSFNTIWLGYRDWWLSKWNGDIYVPVNLMLPHADYIAEENETELKRIDDKLFESIALEAPSYENEFNLGKVLPWHKSFSKEE